MSPDEKVILLVEDNPDDVALTLRALKKSGVAGRVATVGDGVEALDFLFGTGAHADRDPAKTPHLILLDLKLPRVDGIEVLRRIREDARTRLLPVVILTSSQEQRDLVNGYASGANSFIRKPVDFTEFLDAMRQISQYWLRLNVGPHD